MEQIQDFEVPGDDEKKVSIKKELQINKDNNFALMFQNMIKKEIALLSHKDEISNHKDSEYCEPCEKRMTHKQKQEVIFCIKSMFLLFSLLWIIIVCINNFYDSVASYILLIPFIIFAFGFFNADRTCELEVEQDVFSVTFISIGILVSMPLLGIFEKNIIPKDEPKSNETEEDVLKREKRKQHREVFNKKFYRIIFIAMICVLLIYYQFWIPLHQRHIYKAIRSCLETYAITLYIYAIAYFCYDIYYIDNF